MRFRLAHQTKPYTFRLHDASATSAVVDYDGKNVTIGNLDLTTPLLRDRKGRELQLLANALLIANQVPTKVVSRESPDFEVRLSNGDVVYVEITEGIHQMTARRSGNFHKLQVNVANRLAATACPYQTVGYSATFYFGRTPEGQQIKKCTDEIIACLGQEDVLSMVVPAAPVWMPKPVPASYAALASHNVVVMPSGKGAPPYHVHVQLRSHLEFVSLSRAKAANSTIIERLEEKRGRASRWSVGPMWLVIALSDNRWQGPGVLATLQPHIAAINPFTKILVASAGGKVFEIAQKRPIG